MENSEIQQKTLNDCLWFIDHMIHGRLGKIWTVEQMKNIISILHKLHPDAGAFKPAPEILPTIQQEQK